MAAYPRATGSATRFATIGMDVLASRAGPRWRTTIGRDEINAQADEFRGETGKPVQIAFGETGFNHQVGTLHVTETGEPFL